MQTKPVLRHRIILFVQYLNCQLYMLFLCGILSCLLDRLNNPPHICFICIDTELLRYGKQLNTGVNCLKSITSLLPSCVICTDGI